MDVAEALEFIRANHHGVMATTRADGHSAMSPIACAVDADGKVVKKGSAAAKGWMDKLYPWETAVDVSGLQPGEYTFVAMTDDPSGGEGGGPTEDTKTIIVQ